MQLRDVTLAEEATLEPTDDGVFVALANPVPVRTVLTVQGGDGAQQLEVVRVVEVAGADPRGVRGVYAKPAQVEGEATVGSEHLQPTEGSPRGAPSDEEGPSEAPPEATGDGEADAEAAESAPDAAEASADADPDPSDSQLQPTVVISAEDSATSAIPEDLPKKKKKKGKNKKGKKKG